MPPECHRVDADQGPAFSEHSSRNCGGALFPLRIYTYERAPRATGRHLPREVARLASARRNAGRPPKGERSDERTKKGQKKPAMSRDIAGRNNIRARHACIRNDGRAKGARAVIPMQPLGSARCRRTPCRLSEPEGGIDPKEILGTCAYRLNQENPLSRSAGRRGSVLVRGRMRRRASAKMISFGRGKP